MPLSEQALAEAVEDAAVALVRVPRFIVRSTSTSPAAPRCRSAERGCGRPRRSSAVRQRRQPAEAVVAGYR